MHQTLMSLHQLAAEVNSWLDCAKAAEGQACASRISAGKTLAEAKDRVRAGEPGHRSWAKWARENVKVSYRDVNNCTALARSPDPVGALMAERAVARKVMALSWAKAVQTFEPRPDGGQTFDEPKPPTLPLDGAALTLGRLKRDALSLSTKDRIELTEWLTSHTEVQRDRYGNVLDPLPVRLKRVMHRLRKNRRPGNFGLQVGSLVGADEFGDGLRELEEIVSELSQPSASERPSIWDSALPIED